MVSGGIKSLRTSGTYENSLELTREHLRRIDPREFSGDQRSMRLGALQAFRDAGREEHCASWVTTPPRGSAEWPTQTRLIARGLLPELWRGVIPLVLDMVAADRCRLLHLSGTDDNGIQLRSFYPQPSGS